jgi:periplasmic mercuric ion binding protein
MRNALRTLAALAVVLAAGSAAAAERSVTLAVDNMTCETCPPIVRKSLARVPGVARAEVSTETHRAVVTFDDGKTTVAALVDATTKAGYPSRPVR